MFFIIDYSLEEALNILSNLNPENVSEDSFRDTKHVVDSNNKRHKNLNMIYDLLFDGDIVALLKSNYNLFKIIYEHPTLNSKDLCVVVSITDDKGVKLITTLNQPKERRVRTYER
ncbi:MAG: hypothetical protein FWE58_01595 [Methanobrevibacter sp.]|nr:hypothetical protein [Methanobrevibacter sp.]